MSFETSAFSLYTRILSVELKENARVYWKQDIPWNRVKMSGWLARCLIAQLRLFVRVRATEWDRHSCQVSPAVEDALSDNPERVILAVDYHTMASRSPRADTFSDGDAWRRRSGAVSGDSRITCRAGGRGQGAQWVRWPWGIRGERQFKEFEFKYYVLVFKGKYWGRGC